MTDLEILNDVFAPAPPSDAARRDARAALLARERPPRRAPLRIAACLTAAAVVAAFLLVVQDLGDTGPVAAAEVLERAAHAAEAKPFVEPGPHQWVYIEDQIDDNGTPLTRKIWHRVDSGGIAWVDERGDVRVHEFTDAERPPQDAPFDSYDELVKLPTDPDALLRWASEKHVDIYSILSDVLGANLLPPELKAGIFRALERIPGMTVSTTDVFGRQVLSLARTQGGVGQELFLDPETYDYVGRRTTSDGRTTTVVRVKTAVLDAPPR
jgi:hypothetical protein